MKSYIGAALGIAAFAVTACNSSGTQAAEKDAAGDSTLITDAVETRTENSVSTVNPAVVDAPAKPARMAKMDWYLRIDESERSRPAVLVFEQPDTDNQPMLMTCEEGGNRVFVGIHTAMPKFSSLTLTAGTETIDVDGINEPTEVDDLYYFQTSEITADGRFFDEFAKTGWLAYSYYRASTDLVGTSAGDKAVKDFVAHCRGA